MFSGFIKRRRDLDIDEATPIRDVRYVVLDTELTGLDEKKDSIVSIGAVRMEGGRIGLGDTFYSLVNPGTGLTRDSVVIHGITPSDVARKPGVDEVLARFIEFCGTDVIVGHCVSLDLGFINKELKRARGSVLRNPALDTFGMHGWLKKRVYSYRGTADLVREQGLSAVAKGLGIPLSGIHNSLMDAFITAQVFQLFIPMLDGAGIKTIGDLLDVGEALKGGDRFALSGEISSL